MGLAHGPSGEKSGVVQDGNPVLCFPSLAVKQRAWVWSHAWLGSTSVSPPLTMFQVTLWVLKSKHTHPVITHFLLKWSLHRVLVCSVDNSLTGLRETITLTLVPQENGKLCCLQTASLRYEILHCLNKDGEASVYDTTECFQGLAKE